MASVPDLESPQTGNRGTLKRIAIGIVAVALIAIAAWVIRYEVRGRFLEETKDAYVRADSVTVSSKVSGYVEQLYVRDNQDVGDGSPLVRIDPRDYRAQAAQFSAQQDVATANVENVRATILEQQAAVEEARAKLDGARTSQRFADGEVARYAPLAASGAETREKLALLRRQADDARVQVAETRAALASAEGRIVSLRAQVRQARAQGEAAAAQLSAANVNVGSTTLRAGVAGRIGDKSVQVGQFVQPGMRLMTIVPLQALYIVANFKETQIGGMRPGQTVSIRVDALPDAELHGHVESISPGTGAEFSLLPPQNATGNFTKIVQRVPVRIAIDADPAQRHALIAGLSVGVVVDTQSPGRAK